MPQWLQRKQPPAGAPPQELAMILEDLEHRSEQLTQRIAAVRSYL